MLTTAAVQSNDFLSPAETGEEQFAKRRRVDMSMDDLVTIPASNASTLYGDNQSSSSSSSNKLDFSSLPSVPAPSSPAESAISTTSTSSHEELLAELRNMKRQQEHQRVVLSKLFSSLSNNEHASLSQLDLDLTLGHSTGGKSGGSVKQQHARSSGGAGAGKAGATKVKRDVEVTLLDDAMFTSRNATSGNKKRKLAEFTGIAGSTDNLFNTPAQPVIVPSSKATLDESSMALTGAEEQHIDAMDTDSFSKAPLVMADTYSDVRLADEAALDLQYAMRMGNGDDDSNMFKTRSLADEAAAMFDTDEDNSTSLFGDDWASITSGLQNSFASMDLPLDSILGSSSSDDTVSEQHTKVFRSAKDFFANQALDTSSLVASKQFQARVTRNYVDSSRYAFPIINA